MRFNANRLAALAGVTSDGQSGMLNEASNRSYHEDPSLAAERDLQYGKGQLAEGEHEELKDEGEHGDFDDVSFDAGDILAQEGMHDDPEEAMHYEGQGDEEELVEIDEAMLRREIMKMRGQRRQAVAENKIRQAVRNEIREMFGSEDKVYSSSSWVYGDNKPSRSKKGEVAMGALGVGFR